MFEEHIFEIIIPSPKTNDHYEMISQGPRLLTWFNTAWISNYISHKSGKKIANPFLNFTGATIEV